VEQNIKIRDKINQVNHDYQRMRKLAKKRRNGLLDRFNRERAEEERQLRKYLGAEFDVCLKRTLLEKILIAMTWVGVGFLISMWLH
jgi:hypothetical protein